MFRISWCLGRVYVSATVIVWISFWFGCGLAIAVAGVLCRFGSMFCWIWVVTLLVDDCFWVVLV